MTRCARTDCRTTLDENPVTCPHGLRFCNDCTWEEACPECATTSTLTVYDDIEQGTEKWHAIRRGIVTASVVGKLITPTLKVANNDTSRGLITSLAAERITGITEETPMNDDMWRGTVHEPFARDVYSGHYQQAVEVGFMRRDGHGWSLGFSPDGLVGDDGLIEIKCPRAKGHINTILSGEVPAHYMAQVQAGLLVSGRKWLDYVSFHAGLPLFVKRVLPDPDWHEAIVAAAIAFEKAAAQMVADYEVAVRDLPKTERLDFEIKVA